MRLIRIHVDAPLAPGAQVELRSKAAEHVARVLRLKPGDTVTLFNGDGSDYLSEIKDLWKGSVGVMVQYVTPARAESPLALLLVQGIARSERMDLIVQKATELGVTAIQPVAMARSVVRLDDGARARKLAHWRGVAIAASEQCGRATLPEIAEPIGFAAWLQQRPGADTRRIQLAPDAGASLAAAAAGAERIELLVGPEGGLDEPERDAALAAGYLACRLGPRVLRSETAAVAALAVLQSAAGDLN
ncbi:MAG TPA: 16S rRNA (uracil(1498)-N(3))-methyltransferase [Steroidobacteraceae bacterium]|nr:16S rRNA (uracil(1498)-N(3))-methyltransferase [Steroidobacteraceae bacterium]